MQGIRWERIASILVTLILGGVLVYFFFRYAFLLFLPFLLAWLISLGLGPLSRTLSRRMHLPHKAVTVLLLLLFVGLGAWGLWEAISRLIGEAWSLVERLLLDDRLLASVEDWMSRIDGLGAGIGMINGGEGSLGEWLLGAATGAFNSLLSSLATHLPELAGGLVTSLPTVFFIVFITLIAGYYFCTDRERIEAGLISLLPRSAARRLPRIRESMRRFSLRYLRAYLLLFLITFAMLFIGLLILGVEYAFLLALLVAIADLLPVIGVGTVMVPWSVILLLGRNFYLGFGILILYLAIELMRQITEPKLVGKSLGLHPLLMLFSTYAGFYLFGLLGMILAPILTLFAKNLLGILCFSPREHK
ncbi:MAG: sporulation integral membrane protein YtvI [Clostridia bacterium]|nr:sporulation integral membrane protein YtvI [Clostridia bacterium]